MNGSLSRRTVLRGIGVTMALPWLESIPAWGGTISQAGAPVSFPKRFAVMFMGNGINGNHWWARGNGAEMKLSKSLAPLEPIKKKINVINGLFNKPAVGMGIHPVQTGNLLYGVQPFDAIAIGLRILALLGSEEVCVCHIHDTLHVPQPTASRHLAYLRRAGLVMSARGAHGGYWLSRPAEEISMDEVVQALEGSIAPMECFVHDHTERVLCSHQPDAGRGCATKLLWTRVQSGIIRSLQHTTLAALVVWLTRPKEARGR